jgi:hypothetical protein
MRPPFSPVCCSKTDVGDFEGLTRLSSPMRSARIQRD